MKKPNGIFFRWTAALSTAALLTGMAILPPLATPQEREQQQQDYQTLVLPLPPEQSLLALTARVPSQTEVDEPFEYTILVENTSDNVLLHDIVLSQILPQGLNIQSVDGPRTADQQPQGRTQRGGQQQQQGQWTISRLAPGETQQIQVTAAVNETGDLPLCVSVKSYTASLCFVTNVVSKELQVVKRAPESASICQPIELEYFVQNEGNVAIDRVLIRDTLGDNFVTGDGEETLEFAVDGLDPGEVRKFVATVYATEPGTVSSRAVAILPDGEEARSAVTRTRIQEPELAIAMDGPGTQYVGNRFTYTVRVTNRSSIVAPDVDLVLMYPDDVRLLQIGEPRRTGEAVRTGGRGGQQPTRADRQEARQAQRRPQARQEQDWEQRPIEMGAMEPNETRSFSFTAAADDAGLLQFRAVASMVCAVGEAEKMVQAVAMNQTEIIALPALALAVVDKEDPVPVGDEFIYTITVLNEGQAVDNDIELDVQVPDGLEVVEVEGATEGRAEQDRVQFEPVEQLEPGERVSWQLRTKATSAGQANLRAKITSQGLEKPATAEEPTRLINPGREQQERQ